MIKKVDSIVFRRLTYADFRHINKVGGEESGGGGQSYIDFPTADVSLESWFEFLGENTGTGAAGSQWDFTINSLGLKTQRTLRIYQRRAASVSIASQKIHSNKANRVPSWHPDNSFPVDYNPAVDNLVVYIVKTIDGEYWAGWFLKNEIPKNWNVNTELMRLFKEPANYIKFKSDVFIDTDNKDWAFSLKEKSTKEIDDFEHLTNEDVSLEFNDIENSTVPPEVKTRLVKIRQRSRQIVDDLKNLYKGCCQVTGDKFTFRKKNGELYSEAHHLIPLGENGSDSYANVVVISPLIHKMLHYAKVSEIDLSKIKDNKLEIFINDERYEITWHPQHLKTVENNLKG